MSIKYTLKIFLTLSLSLQLLLSLNLFARSESKSQFKSGFLPERMVFQENFDPPGDKRPEDTSGGGSRDGLRCSQDEEPIRALMPKRNYGLTLREHPAIFVDLPNTSARQVVLMFQDEAGEDHGRAFLPITARAGIVSFTLPQEKPPLKVGKNYQWLLVVVCGKTIQPDDPVFRGWVQRVALGSELNRELGQKSAVELAAWYGAKGYWYDMLVAIAQARRSHPNDANLIQIWQDVLKSAGLGAIASDPLLPEN